MNATSDSPDDDLVVWSLPVGLRLGDRYRVQGKIGEGAMACVYRALDEVDDVVVALKVLDPLRGADPVGRARFDREFQLLSRLSHPAVARSIRTARHGDLEILVLEYLEGETLAERLARGALPVIAAVSAGRRLAEAVAVCHDRGILHRDLKPANVMLHPDRGPVILDFGVAWFSAAATLTRTGAVIGSPQYIAPEILRSSVADPRADVYALGVILFEMLTGTTAVTGSDHAPLDDPDERLGPTVFSLRPEVGIEVSAVVARATAPRPEHRYATARELAEALTKPSIRLGKALEARLPCPRCGTSRILDLPLCPGCGEPVDWSLTRGPYAVQLDRLQNVDGVADWLFRRHPSALRLDSATRLKHRLRFQPIPLAVGVSKTSAEQLASEAREVGAEATVVHTRALLGPSLRASEASTTEAIAALGWHFVATTGVAVLLHAMGWRSAWLGALPAVFGVLGIAAVLWYTRRPILAPSSDDGPQTELGAAIRALTAPLKALDHHRSRHLSAQAFSRAAPVLLSSTASEALKDDVRAALVGAVEAVARADAHHSFLAENPRHALAAELERDRSRSDRGDPAAADRRFALEQRKVALTETAIAYDLEVQTALDLCHEMSALASAQPAPLSAGQPRVAGRIPGPAATPKPSPPTDASSTRAPRRAARDG